jgi:hypothetical protein
MSIFRATLRSCAMNRLYQGFGTNVLYVAESIPAAATRGCARFSSRCEP